MSPENRIIKVQKVVLGLARISNHNDDLAYELCINTSSVFPKPIPQDPKTVHCFILYLLNLKGHQEHSMSAPHTETTQANKSEVRGLLILGRYGDLNGMNNHNIVHNFSKIFLSVPSFFSHFPIPSRMQLPTTSSTHQYHHYLSDYSCIYFYIPCL